MTPLYLLNARGARLLSLLGEQLVFSSESLSPTLVAVSAPTADELRTSYPSRSCAIAVIENGVDTARFAPSSLARAEVRRELGVADDTSLSLFVGSEWRRKGLFVALEALAKAPNWHLVVVGRGDTDELLALADQEGARDRVHAIGESTRPERYYAAADAFVLPSEYESFSLAAFEAAASGVPVIATDVGAIHRIVAAGAGRFISRDPDSVAAALVELDSDFAATSTMSTAGRAVAQRLGWDAAVDKYIDLYRADPSATEPRTPGVGVAAR
jgi:UDP-glucose:(heptosyl)LPS alpha-1,3-glucosyltransferase